MRTKIDPPTLSLSAPSPRYHDELPYVEPTIWRGVFWAVVFTMAFCVVAGFIIRTIWS